MRRAIDPEVGYRLAALADGEGCFSIARTKRSFVCSFIIKLRADDAPFLETMRANTGLGVVRYGDSWTGDGAARNPWARWTIERKSECRDLVAIFDEYPLWSRKAEHFSVWREAVIVWSTIQAGEQADWSELDALYRRLRLVRTYAAPMERA